MKVLFIGDAIIQSGFSIVTHNVCNELCTKCDLEVFGIRYDGTTKNPYPYFIYPANVGGDIYSFDLAHKIILKERPDVVVVFNDDNIVADYAYRLTRSGIPIIPMFPINLLPVHKERMLSFSGVDLNIKHLITYTEFSRDRIVEINPNLDITAVYHGVHEGVFFPIKNAKSHLGLDGKFVVGQVNTNTYRKRLDLFLLGFAKFAEGKSDVVCLIHSTNDDMAYDIPSIAMDLNIEDKVILSTNSVDFEKMNLLYNVMDLNCNTSIGEGFGLSLIEGAACGVPALCPEHGNLVDIWSSGADFIEIERQEYVAGTRFIGGVVSVDDLATKFQRFYKDKDYLMHKSQEAYNHSKSDKFLWKAVADKIYKVILQANKKKISYISS